MEIILKHKSSFKQNTELYFRLKRCDAKKKPFQKFVRLLEQSNLHCISDKLTQTLAEMAELIYPEQEKCVYCMLVENLYPDKIVASLYEDSGLSSGTVEEVTLTEGVSRRAAVKTILKKLVKYQKDKGPGRECVDALARFFPETSNYLSYLDSTSINDLKKCKCSYRQESPHKVKPRSQWANDSTDFRFLCNEARLTAKHADDCYVSGRRSYIRLTPFYLGYCVIGEGITEPFDVSSSDVRKAEQCLNNVLKQWENLVKLCWIDCFLAMSDLNMRRKRYQKAMDLAQEALKVRKREP